MLKAWPSKKLKHWSAEPSPPNQAINMQDTSGWERWGMVSPTALSKIKYASAVYNVHMIHQYASAVYNVH